MKHLLLIILTSSILSKVAFAQNDTLFKSETMPLEFRKMKVENLIAKYGFNDTAKLMINIYCDKHRHLRKYAITSICMIPVGFGILEIAKNDLLIAISAGIPAILLLYSGLPIFTLSELLKTSFNRKALYKDLRYYYLNNKFSLKSKWKIKWNYSD